MKKETTLQHFQQLYQIIQNAHTKALHSVNFEQLNLFWQVGAFVDQKIASGSWGDKVVDEFATWLKEKDTSVKNFDRRNIYRMREFFVSWCNVNWSLDSSGLSIVGLSKPQIQATDNEVGKIVVSAKPQLQTTDNEDDIIVVSAKPQLQTTDNEVDKIGVSAKPQLQTTDNEDDKIGVSAKPQLQTMDNEVDKIEVSVKPQLQTPDNEVDIIGVSAKPQLPKIPAWLGTIPWTHHLTILSGTKDIEERAFYILLTEREKYTVKELRRQFASSLYERFLPRSTGP